MAAAGTVSGGVFVRISCIFTSETLEGTPRRADFSGGEEEGEEEESGTASIIGTRVEEGGAGVRTSAATAPGCFVAAAGRPSVNLTGSSKATVAVRWCSPTRASFAAGISCSIVAEEEHLEEQRQEEEAIEEEEEATEQEHEEEEKATEEEEVVVEEQEAEHEQATEEVSTEFATTAAPPLPPPEGDLCSRGRLFGLVDLVSIMLLPLLPPPPEGAKLRLLLSSARSAIACAAATTGGGGTCTSWSTGSAPSST